MSALREAYHHRRGLSFAQLVRLHLVDCHDGGYFYCPDICKVIVPIMFSLLTIPIHYDILKKRTNTDFLYSHWWVTMMVEMSLVELPNTLSKLQRVMCSCPLWYRGRSVCAVRYWDIRSFAYPFRLLVGKDRQKTCMLGWKLSFLDSFFGSY